MDETVLKAYGWEDIDLAHDFYEVDYLPENDRVRYTILPDARKEVLKCLLKLNHEIHEQEVKADLHTKGKTKKKQKADATALESSESQVTQLATPQFKGIASVSRKHLIQKKIIN